MLSSRLDWALAPRHPWLRAGQCYARQELPKLIASLARQVTALLFLNLRNRRERRCKRFADSCSAVCARHASVTSSLTITAPRSVPQRLRIGARVLDRLGLAVVRHRRSTVQIVCPRSMPAPDAHSVGAIRLAGLNAKPYRLCPALVAAAIGLTPDAVIVVMRE